MSLMEAAEIGQSSPGLDGVRVVECATFVAGPFATLTLSQLGARILRVDLPEGGSDRFRWPVSATGQSYYWHGLNATKESVLIDYRNARGRELLRELAASGGDGGGIYVDNVVGRHALRYDELTARRADMIFFHVQGHPDGRPSVDYLVNAEIGVPDITGPELLDGPVNHVLPAWDLLTGSTVCNGVLAAILRRRSTGKGTYADVALADVALGAVGSLGWLSEAASSGDRPRHGNHVFGSFGVDFETSDRRRVMVVALTDGQWQALCQATGTRRTFEALSEALDLDLADEKVRYSVRDAIAGVLKPWFAERTASEVAWELDRARVLWSPYRTMSEAVARERLAAESLVAPLHQAGVGEMIFPRSPIRSSAVDGRRAPAPVLGADTERVLLEELGLSSRQIGHLAGDGVIAMSTDADPLEVGA